MNIEQAKAIPLAQLLEAIGCKPTRVKTKESTYSSPLRNERTPSFQVNHAKNLWFDHGIAKGGTPVDFACAYLESCKEPCTISDALRWLANMSGNAPAIRPIPVPVLDKENHSLEVKRIQPIKHPALVGYLQKRAIPLKFATPYVVEVFVHNRESGKNFFALGASNEEGGYEVRNPFFKGCVGPKAISFIRGSKPKPEGIQIFEGFLDYASAITYRNVKRFEEDTIILNSLSCLKQATPYIKGYGYRVAYTWLDNDKAGQKGTETLAEFFKTEDNLQHQRMNAVYLPHKDMNAWLVSTKLSL